MKKLLFLFCLLMTATVLAEPDPFSVYTAKAPEGCINSSKFNATHVDSNRDL